MTPQEEARERARLLIAFADGAQLQHYMQKAWRDWSPLDSPLIQGPKFWRIKPEPRKRWVIESSGLSSCDPHFKPYWESVGETVTEWREVVK